MSTLTEWRQESDRRAARLERQTHYVYRAFDAHGLLLYIGCTVDLGNRMSNHRIRSEWYPHMDDMQVNAYATRSDARQAEFLAIESEGSHFNATRRDIWDIQARRNAGRRHPERTAAELDEKYPSLSGDDRLARYIADRDTGA